MSESKSEFDVAAVVDALDVGVIVLDERQGVVGWNEWIARVSRKPLPAVLGKNLIELFPNLASTRLPSVIADCLQTGSSSILTHSLNKLLPLHGEGGEELLHNIVVRPVWSNGAPRCMLQVNDVSVPVARERVLRERQNARYHAIVDSAPDAIITIGLDHNIQWANGAAEQVFGYELSELLDQKLDVLLQHDDGLAQAFVDLQHSNSCTVQVNGRRKDGELCQFDVSLGRWKADERVFITTIWRDVTERTTAEAALRDSEGRHRALLEALPQLVWTCDQHGECDYFNPQWQAYTGAPSGEHLGSGWLKAIHREDTPGFIESWKSALADGGVFDVDVRLCRHDGTNRWFKMRSIPVLEPGGNISRWFGTATDITDHVEAREALRRSNEELEALVQERTRERELALNQLHEAQKMETIGQLTGGVAHDFNNLLAVILGSLSLLKKWLPDDPRTSRLLDGALQGAERGATLTKRLLAFARRQELKLEAVEIQKLIPDMMDFLRQSLGPNINISIDIPPEVEPVKIDANQLELALMNLAVNARDAMPAGGALVITCRNDAAATNPRPSALPDGDYVCISVADTGEGMDQATLAKAMEPFFTTKGLGKGTGLGLSMVQGLTVQSGGALTMTSDVGKGTVVNLWLPQARREDMVAPVAGLAPLSSGAVSKQLRILLVDDDPLVRMNTAYLLMDLGHSVMEAQSGAQALQLLDSDARFDVLLTDYAMPGMTGLDLAIRVKVLKPKLPIVLATGYAELPPDALLGFPRLGKPYTQDQLAESLEAAIRDRVN
ncbi:PAS domain S-box-containing protein [Rhodopseudomonas rhenobacensis]|uniref:histidine kinase n=1 Tax=Rhodopseudomonas rhenobacensis TaxID=87461 RepID=A0A7W7Z1Z8_9BRAD|nr:PAS domain-containing sensor histidine kinase [Rhodopseudomonas rhenobacensis]MBB5046197.1 PAS domain S-box-containing protein [Rhodopseudomonas rhenobacensis]